MSQVRYRAAALMMVGLGCGLPGCLRARSDLVTRLEDPAPEVRIRAIQDLVVRERRELLPQLVDRLEDEDAAVRLYAILGLERLTGTRLNYSAHGSRKARRESAAAWRAYLAERQPPSTPAG